MKHVCIEWWDSRRPADEWVFVGDAEFSACRCRSVGFVLRETEEEIVLAQSIADGGEQACGVMVIPRCCIISSSSVSG